VLQRGQPAQLHQLVGGGGGQVGRAQLPPAQGRERCRWVGGVR
jgi:hypothetical protein